MVLLILRFDKESVNIILTTDNFCFRKSINLMKNKSYKESFMVDKFIYFLFVTFRLLLLHQVVLQMCQVIIFYQYLLLGVFEMSIGVFYVSYRFHRGVVYVSSRCLLSSFQVSSTCHLGVLYVSYRCYLGVVIGVIQVYSMCRLVLRQVHTDSVMISLK